MLTAADAPFRLGYRPALDGIRGLSVTAVLLFHAGVTLFRGGSLGVDVFFVLTRFLITSLSLAFSLYPSDQASRGELGGRHRRRGALALMLAASLWFYVVEGRCLRLQERFRRTAPVRASIVDCGAAHGAGRPVDVSALSEVAAAGLVPYSSAARLILRVTASCRSERALSTRTSSSPRKTGLRAGCPPGSASTFVLRPAE